MPMCTVGVTFNLCFKIYIFVHLPFSSFTVVATQLGHITPPWTVTHPLEKLNNNWTSGTLTTTTLET